jgi:chromosomal replication initiator protein
MLKNRIPEFQSAYRSIDVLLVDDIHYFSNKNGTQDQFFHLFNSLYHSGKQIVLTSDTPPNKIQGVVERLISRFNWGLVVDIKPPDLESRVAILRQKASNHNTDIPSDVLFYIAENITSNVRALEGSLIRLIAHASLQGKGIGMEIAREVVSFYTTETANKTVTHGAIIDAVCNHFNITRKDLIGKGRTKRVAEARQVAMYLAREMTDASLDSIGTSIGGRDHSTVSYACNKVNKLISKDNVFAGMINGLKMKL